MQKSIFTILFSLTLALAWSQDHIVEVSSNEFTPENLTIQVGETVEWRNTGGFHNVNGTTETYPDNPEGFGNGNASSAAWTYQFTFTVPGVYDYQCDPHVTVGMVGTITVESGNDYPLYTIGEVTTNNADGEPDSLGVVCEVRGVVHGVNLRSGGLQFTIIDENNDGMGIFSGGDNFGYTVNEGDLVAVQGEVGFFNGLTQMNPDSVFLIESGADLQTPTVVTALGEETESQLVTLEDVMVVDPGQWTNSGAGFNVEVTNGTNTFEIRIDNEVNLYSMLAPTGTFDVTGIGGQFDPEAPYDEGYQLLPRYTEDINPYNTGGGGNDEFPARTVGEMTTNDADGQPDSLGAKAALTGIVHGVNLREGGLQFTIIDANNDGIGVFNGGQTFDYEVNEGDEVTIEGEIGFFNGLTQINAENVTLQSSGNALQTPNIITTLGESTESQLVTMENVTLVNPADWDGSGSGFNVEVTDGTNTITVRIDNDVDLFDMPAPTGAFDVTGIGGQFDTDAPYDEGYQLLPRYMQDISEVGGGDPSFPLRSIAEVTTNDADGEPDSLGITCELRGIVHGVNLRPGGLQFTIIDVNGDGIGVFNNGDNLGYTVTEGDEIAIQGEIGFFNGLTQINAENVDVLSTGNLLQNPIVVTALSEDTESQLIQIDGLTLVDPSDWSNSGSGFNVEVTNGTNTFEMRIDADVNIFGTAAPTLPFRLTGIGGQFDNSVPYDEGYQVLPRYLDDIDLITNTVSAVLPKEIQFYPNPVENNLTIDSEIDLTSISIFDQLGREVLRFAKPGARTNLQLKALPTGVYTILFTSNEENWSAELMKK